MIEAPSEAVRNCGRRHPEPAIIARRVALSKAGFHVGAPSGLRRLPLPRLAPVLAHGRAALLHLQRRDGERLYPVTGRERVRRRALPVPSLRPVEVLRSDASPIVRAKRGGDCRQRGWERARPSRRAARAWIALGRRVEVAMTFGHLLGCAGRTGRDLLRLAKPDEPRPLPETIVPLRLRKAHPGGRFRGVGSTMGGGLSCPASLTPLPHPRRTPSGTAATRAAVTWRKCCMAIVYAIHLARRSSRSNK